MFAVSTRYFESDTADGFREPGFSKQRRLEPQIALGLLTDAAGFSLAVDTMLPVINAFKAAPPLTDVTVVADARMISEANQVALQAAGLSSCWEPASRGCPVWWANGATHTPTRRFLTGWC